ncbi:16S rRNA (cytidine(1402)-2'-O)-methyltransferase [uncultured Limosilactobacillus sp.]|uniref:16S rRNA (cytidine(1402)-2'-O)-methyltransferase n=1 Tax=uncultured Limosilactobacillus sp. TaxID=2837629 RepID=UPI0025DD57C7|nr:16S rRNA (cytidine(1402)-2'-O)-methyltransferase [uncultured Limosilactobacillus sp.]
MQAVSSFQESINGRLFLVPTPIGNLDDMTFRAIKVLREVDLIAAEDTRHTRQLLNHFEIDTPMISFHEHNTEQRIPQLLERLTQGESIAQCSDAGMPSISDPGKELVAACVQANIPVIPLPGANAGLTALIASGLVPQPFYFYGFLERKTSLQQESLAALKERQETIIFYEAPHRLAKTLQNMVTIIGPERPVVLARELTKRYEEFIRGSLAEVLAWAQTDQVRGEFVILLAGHPGDDDKSSEITENPIDQIKHLIDQGEKVNTAIKLVAKKRGLNRQALYREFHNL